MMTMIAHEGNESNDGIEDIDVLNTYYILLPYPDASAYALAKILRQISIKIFRQIRIEIFRQIKGQ